MSRWTKTEIILCSLLIPIVLGYFFPQLWTRMFWNVPGRAPQQDAWAYYESLSLLPKVPEWVARRAQDGSLRGRSIIYGLYDAEFAHWENVYKKDAPQNAGLDVPVFPPIAFGVRAEVDLTKDLPQPIGQLLARSQLDGPTECRGTALVNPAPFSTSSDFCPVLLRAVCPCSTVPGRWTLYEKLITWSSKLQRLAEGVGLYSERCVADDPMTLLNRAPHYASACFGSECIRVLRTQLTVGKGLPPWPIYVEHKGKLRRAVEADMKYVSQGIFKIPD